MASAQKERQRRQRVSVDSFRFFVSWGGLRRSVDFVAGVGLPLCVVGKASVTGGPGHPQPPHHRYRGWLSPRGDVQVSTIARHRFAHWSNTYGERQANSGALLRLHRMFRSFLWRFSRDHRGRGPSDSGLRHLPGQAVPRPSAP